MTHGGGSGGPAPAVGAAASGAVLGVLLVVLLAAPARAPEDAERLNGDPATAAGPLASGPGDTAWVALFNGTDLSGWTPKIRGWEAGEDPLGTFRVEDGLLTVGYEGYERFEDRFGHLFHDVPYARYRLRVEYRFVGEQAAGGEAWAFKNSGVMFHAQSPWTMLRGQDFPIALEAQLLGGRGTDERPTGNLCTPGTHVEIDGARVEDHCIRADAPTFHAREWVTLELRVDADSDIAHLVNGDVVLRYARPVVGGGAVNGYDPAVKVDGAPLREGFIAVQSESHPIQFRSVLIRQLGR